MATLAAIFSPVLELHFPLEERPCDWSRIQVFCACTWVSSEHDPDAHRAWAEHVAEELLAVTHEIARRFGVGGR